MRKSVYTILLASALVSTAAYAGNPSRAGSAGASELLINPWAQSSGLANSNIASTVGLEATFLNIAGLAHAKSTEIGFANTQWLIGSGVSVNSFGIAQKVSDGGRLSLNFQSFDYGEWDVTTETSPDGGAGTISPTAIVIGLGYAQKFTDNIFGGVNIKIFNSTISNLSATGVGIDAGVQYVAGDKREYKFGIALKNVGPSFGYRGDGLSLSLPVPQGGYSQSFDSRSQSFELPTQLSLGVAYDWHIEEKVHVLTFSGSFVSNSFEKDNFLFGVQYGYKDWLAVRGGYHLNDDRADGMNTSALVGPTAGVTFNAPIGNSYFRVDYAYRMTPTFGGIHTIGAAFDL